MNKSSIVLLVVLGLVLARWTAQFWLSRLNQRNVRAHADAIPAAFQGMIDEATYAKSVKYTLARSRFGQLERAWEALILAIVLFSGVLPWGFHLFAGRLGGSV